MAGRNAMPGAGHAGRRSSHGPDRLRALRVAVPCAWLTQWSGLSAWAQAEPPEPARYETVVTASREPRQARADGAAAASVITPERTPRSAESAAELLAEQPGVSVTRLGGLGASATLSIRGSTADQVAVYLDGIPLTSAVGGGVDLALLPVDDLGRIEVYRGQSPMAFAASAMAGVVSLESRELGAPEAAANLGAGAFGTRLGGARASGRRGDLGGLLALRVLDSRGDFPYWHDGGTAFEPGDDRTTRRSNNALTQLDGTARGEVRLSGGHRLTLAGWWLDRDQGLAGDVLRPTTAAHLHLTRWIAALRHEWVGGTDSGVSDAGPAPGPGIRQVRTQLYLVDELSRFDDPRAEFGLGQRRAHDRTQRLGLTVHGERAQGDRLRLAATADARAERFLPDNALPGQLDGPPAERRFLSVGAELGVRLPGRLRIAPSARAELAHDELLARNLSGIFSDTTRPASYVLPIARMAVTWLARDELELRANVGRYARLPSLRERYGNTGLYLGNPELRPESGVNADLGIVLRLPALGTRVDTGLFAARADDLIQLERATYRTRSANVAQAEIRGVEVALWAEPRRWSRVVGQLTHTDARDRSDIAARSGRQLPLRPRTRAYLRPELRELRVPGLSRGPAGLRLGLYADLDHTSGNYLDPANLVVLPARTLWGAGLHVELGPATSRLRLVASARNLGDARVVDLAGFPLPGRSFWLDLQWSGDWSRAAPLE